MAHKSVPWYAKALIIFTIGYALSPVDLIPDFIPVLGVLDDLVLLPLFIYIAIKLIPVDTLRDCRRRAESLEFTGKKNWLVGGLILVAWITVITWVTIRLTS